MLGALDYTGLQAAHAPLEALACCREFANARDTLLQQHPWVFARKEAALAQLSTSVEGWRYAYALPTDCLTVLSLVASPPKREGITHTLPIRRYHRGTGVMALEHWEQIGRVIGCDYPNIRIRYTWEYTDTNSWEPAFSDAFCFSLARAIAISVVQNPTVAYNLSTSMLGLLQASILQAKKIGAIAGAHELPRQETLNMDYSGVKTGFDDPGFWGY
jgi:hypothetical protein